MHRIAWLLLGATLLGITILPVVAHQPKATYDLGWWTVDGGGATFSTRGGYSLGGTIGQPDAGALSGGGYTLGGGFWSGGAARPVYRLYLPLIVRHF